MDRFGLALVRVPTVPVFKTVLPVRFQTGSNFKFPGRFETFLVSAV